MSLVVGMCGGSGSGKSTLAARVADRVVAERGPGAAAVVSFDSYYHDQAELPMAERRAVNYDHPSSLDGGLLARHLLALRGGADIAVPVYDFACYTRTGEHRPVAAADVVIVEGILLFSFPEVWAQLDLSVFRDCPEDVRFARRIRRDLVERGRSRESVLAQLESTVKPMHDRFVQPFADRADLVTRHGDDLDRAADRVTGRVLALAASPSATPLALGSV